MEENKKKDFNLSFQYIGEDDNDNPISPDDNKMYEMLKDTLFTIDSDIKNTYSFNNNLSVLDIFDDIYSENPNMAISLYLKLLNSFKSKLDDNIISYYLVEPFQEVFEPTNSFNMFDFIRETKNTDAINILFGKVSYFSDILLENLLNSNSINDINFLKEVLININANKQININPESLNKSEIRYIILNNFKDEPEICKHIIETLKD